MAKKDKKKTGSDEAQEPKPSLAQRVGRETRFWLVSFAVAAAIIFPLRAALADWYDVPTGSMRPTILEGDRILVHNWSFGLRVPMTRKWVGKWGEIHRGDIVTFASPRDGSRLVKRVIGLPGDTLQVVDNRVVLNGEPIEYEFLEDIREPVRIGRQERSLEAKLYREMLPGREHTITVVPAIQNQYRNTPEFTVPEDHFFMMGDNRDQSFDSRGFGFVPINSVYGRSSHIAVSFAGDNLLLKWFQPRFSRWGDKLH